MYLGDPHQVLVGQSARTLAAVMRLSLLLTLNFPRLSHKLYTTLVVSRCCAGCDSDCDSKTTGDAV